MISKIFSLIKALFSAGGIILKVLKIFIIVGILWFIFIYLNNKLHILKPIQSIFSACYQGIRQSFSLLGIG